ncbi:hypothetical protein HDV05_000703, partial [Chytridiales sp. JEL 0842]
SPSKTSLVLFPSPPSHDDSSHSNLPFGTDSDDSTLTPAAPVHQLRAGGDEDDGNQDQDPQGLPTIQDSGSVVPLPGFFHGLHVPSTPAAPAAPSAVGGEGFNKDDLVAEIEDSLEEEGASQDPLQEDASSQDHPEEQGPSFNQKLRWFLQPAPIKIPESSLPGHQPCGSLPFSQRSTPHQKSQRVLEGDQSERKEVGRKRKVVLRL